MPRSSPPKDSPAGRAAHDTRRDRTRERVLAAVCDLLIEGGAAAAPIERVVERSGVARSTIYRHWRSQPALIFDAFRALMAPDAVSTLAALDRTGKPRDVIKSLLEALVAGLQHARWGPVIPSLIALAETDPEMRALMREFLASVAGLGCDVLRAAVARGELPASLDVELCVEALLGPLYYRRLLTGEVSDSAYIDQLIHQVLGEML